MQKTYWWRIITLLVGIIIFSYSYVASYGNDFGLCRIENGVEKCILKYGPYVDALGFLAISIMIISPFLFFFSDKIFLKWFRFALIWFSMALIFIALAPVYTGGWMSFGPTKESVSIWMGSLFVIISLGMFVREWVSRKN